MAQLKPVAVGSIVWWYKSKVIHPGKEQNFMHRPTNKHRKGVSRKFENVALDFCCYPLILTKIPNCSLLTEKHTTLFY